jgi:hypothetical protein
MDCRPTRPRRGRLNRRNCIQAWCRDPNSAVTLGDMEDSSLPTNTMLDGPERDPGLDDEMVAVLKAIYLTQSHVPAFRARGMSDAEIVDTLHGMVQAGLLKIVRNGGKVGLMPTDAGAAAISLESPGSLTPRQQKAKAKRRQHRRLFRR